MRPLFIPLRRKYFEAFETGGKRVEWRSYGQRWNERTCAIGRSIVLSLGYNGRRIQGYVVWFGIVPRNAAAQEARDIFPLSERFACIGIELLQKKGATQAPKGVAEENSDQ